MVLSVVCTQCIIQSKISAFPGPYSTLKCPLCRSLLLNSKKTLHAAFGKSSARYFIASANGPLKTVCFGPEGYWIMT